MFYKEAKHGGATRSTLQPEENWSLLTGLAIREEHMSTAPPSGNFTSSTHLLAEPHISCFSVFFQLNLNQK